MKLHFNFFKKPAAKLEEELEERAPQKAGTKPAPSKSAEPPADKPPASKPTAKAPTGSERSSNAAQQVEDEVKANAKEFGKDSPVNKALIEKAEQPEKKQPLLKRLFTKTAAEEVDDKIAKNTQKVLKREENKHKKERRTAQYRKKMLNGLLMQAGLDIRHERLSKVVFYVSLFLISILSLTTLTIAAINGKDVLDIVLFNVGLWTALFGFVYLMVWMVIYLYLDIRIYQRTRELEEVLPDFLQLASTNISAGMPIDRALWFAVRPNFGVLAKEIEKVAKETIAGEELNESLRKFTNRYDSATLRRSINILLEGIAAGGEIADLLNKIALDIQETRILRKEMAASVATYAIFITFASIVMAPILFALATQLLTIIVTITSTLDLSSSSSSFFTLNLQADASTISDFRWFSIFMLTISGVMSASIVAVIRKGRVKDGLRNLPIFVMVSLFIYFFASTVLGTLMGSML